MNQEKWFWGTGLYSAKKEGNIWKENLKHKQELSLFLVFQVYFNFSLINHFWNIWIYNQTFQEKKPCEHMKYT